MPGGNKTGYRFRLPGMGIMASLLIITTACRRLKCNITTFIRVKAEGWPYCRNGNYPFFLEMWNMHQEIGNYGRLAVLFAEMSFKMQFVVSEMRLHALIILILR